MSWHTQGKVGGRETTWPCRICTTVAEREKSKTTFDNV